MRPINLLPPESAERRRNRQITSRLLLLGLGYLLLLALLTLLFTGRIGDAERRLEDQAVINGQLEQQVASLSDVQELQQRYEDDAELITVALDGEVSWGRVLNDMGRMIPDRVWLLSFNGIGQVEEASLGTIDVAADGFDVPDISAWLRALDSDRFPSVTGAWVPTARTAVIGVNEVWTFTSSAVLTEAAASNRADDRIPELSE
jgi:Tfp pilus assembly protein PilN